jgi:CHC2 zinc finger
MALSQELIDRARARNILDVAPSGLKGRRQRYGPCPRCGGTDRFWIDPRKQCWGCRGCKEGGDVIALALFLQGCGFADAVELLAGQSLRPAANSTEVIAKDNNVGNTSDVAAYLWSIRQPIQGSLAETYLREARGITCPLPPTLAFLPLHKDQPPRMIAAFGFAAETAPGVLEAPSRVTAIHRTFLAPDGLGRSAKKFLGDLGDKPIVIAPPNDSLGLAITEGIEDGLSVYQATGLGVWVASCAGRMPVIARMVPRWIECVMIYAHDDGGKRDALDAANVLFKRNIEVRIDGLGARP